MTIYEEIARLEDAANRIKTKTSELGLIKDNKSNVTTSDKLQLQAEAIENIVKMSTPTISLSNESQTINCKDKLMDGNITIPASNVYYTGSVAPDSSTPGKDGDLFLVI